ncbi:histone lysine demethylase PHF8-like isoform X2 [Neocloeon triangulifer]|uniref:histone lysine demethylase PHF8-like isoform X2 n=1 Tax=Neocloeon triangulifer TaxID=2078957 RepID=UPI00286F1528|nr:histone lysine demethylase PHF8-like isoform X2 [Neocloeon triangulifer]
MATITESCFWCGQQFQDEFVLKCGACANCYHSRCVGTLEILAQDFADYHCSQCIVLVGPTIYKQPTNNHRHDRYEIDLDGKATQTGTPKFISELKTRIFCSASEIVKRSNGVDFNINHLTEHGFSNPVLLEPAESIEGFQMVSKDFDFYNVPQVIDGTKEITAICCTSQSATRLNVDDYIKYYTSGDRSRILNVLSLEYCNTELNNLVTAPLVIRQMDWRNNVMGPGEWPADFDNRPVHSCLIMSVADCYTDFHMDFGGSSVWYHLLKGEKVFYLIPPTQPNRAMYQRWLNSSKRLEMFFADQVEKCYQFVLTAGQTIVIPGGWIHAVLTTKDSIMFGGNFLTDFNIELQLAAYAIEKASHTPASFCFPNFEGLHWFAADSITNRLRLIHQNGQKCPDYLLRGVKALNTHLKVWKNKEVQKGRNLSVPEGLDGAVVLRELSKAIRNAERLINTLNPPKPERESKRMKKKPIDKDFVDLTQPLSTKVAQEQRVSLKVINNKLDFPSEPSSFDQYPAELKEEPPAEIKAEPVTSLKLRFTLGGKPVAETSVPTARVKDAPTAIRDPYAFDASDEEQLHIDERPKKIRKSEKKLPRLDGTDQSVFSEALQGDVVMEPVETVSTLDLGGEVDIVAFVDPKAGQQKSSKESKSSKKKKKEKLFVKPETPKILQTPPPQQETISLGSVLPMIGHVPSMSKMQSIANQPPPVQKINPPLRISVKPDKKASKAPEEETEEPPEDPVANVHQDDDYVYPSLDGSDEEDFVFKPRGRRKMDEAWNPKARVGPVVPKKDRPIREGTKKQSVEKGLEAAAAKRAGQPAAKRPYIRRKPRPIPKNSPPAANITTVHGPGDLVIATLTSSAKKADKAKKPKKGMKTAKQRLGKILKIHRMNLN